MPPDVNAYTTALGQLDAYGQAHPDFAGSWVGGPDQSVMVEAFTGELATHQAELSAIYPRVCVTQGTRTMTALRSVQAQLQSSRCRTATACSDRESAWTRTAPPARSS
jgi:hypothetical protein